MFQVGIIMYLPTMDARQRKEITEEFFHYRRLTQSQLWDHYSAYEHWAKIEVLHKFLYDKLEMKRCWINSTIVYHIVIRLSFGLPVYNILNNESYHIQT